MDKAKYIDHTLLKADASKREINAIIAEAKEYGFKTVCVNSSYVKHAATELKGTGVGVTSVIGFPLGAMISEAKAFEAKEAIAHGADEIDMVIQIGKLKDGEFEYVLNDINTVKAAMGDKPLKVIIETALLTNVEAIKATEIVKQSNADFVKTSTGFSTRGATKEDIKMMKSIMGDTKGIKAAGGVKTTQDLDEMIELGATRIGTSSGVALIKGDTAEEGY